MRFNVELWRRRRRAGWLALVWAGVELKQVIFFDGVEGDAWWAAQEWVALHGGGASVSLS